jgi:hypothetical protein
LDCDAHHGAIALGPDLRAPHVAQTDQVAVAVGQDQRAVLLRRLELAERADGELLVAALHAPRRDVHVLALERVGHVRDGEPARREPLVVDPQADRVAALTAEPHRGNPGQLREPILDARLGQHGELDLVEAAPGQVEPHDLAAVGVGLRDDRLLHGIGQEPPRARHAIAHLRRRHVDVPVDFELHGDEGHLLAALRGEVLDALDADDLVFQHLGDRGLHHLGRGAR